jgi:hypothetical protein
MAGDIVEIVHRAGRGGQLGQLSYL